MTHLRSAPSMPLAIAAALAFGAFAGLSTSASAQEQNLIFGAGGTSGSYYPIGGALKGVFEESDQVGNVQVVATGASVANIQNIQDGLNQVAIVMSDVAFDAVEGRGQFEGNPVDLKAIAGLYPNVVQIVATSDSGITSVEDLKGKRIGVGKVGSGVEQSASKVLEAAGLSYDDMARVSHTGYADSVTEMSNGTLDAAFFTSGVPNSSITGLMQSSEVTFVPVDGEIAEKLLDSYPYYVTYELPAGDEKAYGLDSAVPTVAIRNMLVVPGSMDEDLAGELAKRFSDYLKSGTVSVSALNQFDPATMDEGLVAPVHPGAQKFYDAEAGASAGEAAPQ
ncbi:TAXI family TRAP transporter solute-binding subunit [Fulvimarina sp. 2208YS6-2-32]|uniref:TAXI family TRAP transporter solute-binding subunit n=1 Tax=Fulvimarina uroteuthidis TaxID=3098149 RepID=A0ABU5I1E1_9HYPH|nr:TAXI family TRAP transporter solute-binding subunit [Fulvimarina sp. 2208YS6-2-32]MDY8109162.1 TAXI family TRAP transporter solute-binding subunit [Fulvimarina sp. 2208YS6-2-32]